MVISNFVAARRAARRVGGQQQRVHRRLLDRARVRAALHRVDAGREVAGRAGPRVARVLRVVERCGERSVDHEARRRALEVVAEVESCGRAADRAAHRLGDQNAARVADCARAEAEELDTDLPIQEDRALQHTHTLCNYKTK